MIKRGFDTKRSIIVALSALFAFYVLYQARFLIMGPVVDIETPQDGEMAAVPVITVSGTARNVAWLSLNGRQIFTDEDGRWSERLIVHRGLSIITATAIDRFGREREEEVRVILN